MRSWLVRSGLVTHDLREAIRITGTPTLARQLEAKCRASAVGAQDGARDREPEADAAIGFARAPVELLEDFLFVASGDPRPAVGDFDGHRPLRLEGRDLDGTFHGG